MQRRQEFGTDVEGLIKHLDALHVHRLLKKLGAQVFIDGVGAGGLQQTIRLPRHLNSGNARVHVLRSSRSFKKTVQKNHSLRKTRTANNSRERALVSIGWRNVAPLHYSLWLSVDLRMGGHSCSKWTLALQYPLSHQALCWDTRYPGVRLL